jgi:hypothetical protein
MVKASHSHACALSCEGLVKCWGANHLGQLGYGDTMNRGFTHAEMGDALPFVKLGHDPAVGSSVMITACTDSGGFFIFLGLATFFLL